MTHRKPESGKQPSDRPGIGKTDGPGKSSEPSSKPPPPPNPERLDPQLESLLLRAQTILAEERGLNARCRAKIQALGKRMKMPGALIDQAIQRLHGAPPVQATEESSYERGFARVMQEKIAGIPGKILTTRIEEKAISVGVRKYLLSEIQARRIVRRVAHEVDVPRVSLTEAERHIEQEIADVVGEETSVTGEKKKRLIKNGSRLGVSAAQVESMIRRYLQFNFQQVQYERKLTDRLWVLVTCIVAGTGLALFVFFQIKNAKREENAVAKVSEKQKKDVDNQSKSNPELAPPEWWTDSLKVLLQKTRLKVKGFAEIHDQLQSQSAPRRASAYRKLMRLDEGQLNPISVRGRLKLVIPELLRSEPDPKAYVGLLDGLEKAAGLPDGKLPNSIDFSARAEWALEIANQVAGFEDLDNSKLDALQQRVEQMTGRSFDLYLGEEPRLQKVYRSLLEKHLNLLIDLAPSYPSAGPTLFEKYLGRASSELSSEKVQEFRYRFVVGFLRFEADEWKQCAQLLENAVVESSVGQVSVFIDLMEATEIEPLQYFLQERLYRRASFGLDVATIEESVSRLREYFELNPGGTASKAVAGVERLNESVTKFSQKWLAKPSILERKELAQMWAESVYLTTIAAILNEDPLLADEMLEVGFPDINSSTYLAALQQESEFMGSGPTPDESLPVPGSREARYARQRLKNGLSQLNQFRILKPERRIAALTLIREIAPNIQRLVGSEAAILAEYLISRKNPTEDNSMVESLPEFRRWPELKVAISDHLLQDNYPKSTVLKVASLLLNEDLRFEGDQWQEDLSRYLAQVALSELSQSPTNDRAGSDPLQNLKMILAHFFGLRARLHNASIEVDGNKDLSELLNSTYQALRLELQRKKKLELLGELDKQEQVGRLLPGGVFQEIHRLTGLNEAALQGLARPGETNATATERRSQIESLLQSRVSKYPSILGQIIETECRLFLIYQQSIE